MLDLYFKRPILWDYSVAITLAGTAWYSVHIGVMKLPPADHLRSTVSDMSTISLTMAGFILTLVTVLISFKSTNKINKANIKEGEKVFDLFFVSKLYFQTIRILNNSIKSLSAIALLGYVLKLILDNTAMPLLFSYCILGVSIIIFTVLRSVVILTTIVKMQEGE